MAWNITYKKIKKVSTLNFHRPNQKTKKKIDPKQQQQIKKVKSTESKKQQQQQRQPISRKQINEWKRKPATKPEENNEWENLTTTTKQK